MAIGKKTGGRSFPRGHKFAKGGRRNPPGGRPTNEARATKKAELEVKEKELAIAKDVWEKEIKSREQDLAKRYVEQAMKDNRSFAGPEENKNSGRSERQGHPGQAASYLQLR